MVYTQCGSSCDFSGGQIENMFCHIQCIDVVSLQCGSSCDSSDGQIEKIFGYILCIDVVSPVCGSSCDYSGGQIEKMFDHILYIDMLFSPVCILKCIFSLLFRENNWPHSLQGYCFFSVHKFMWCFKSDNIFLHWSHCSWDISSCGDSGLKTSMTVGYYATETMIINQQKQIIGN